MCMPGYQLHFHRYRFLSRNQIEQVHESTLQLLETVGCRVDCQEALDILAGIGCEVKDKSRVKFPRKRVMEALEAAPKKINIYDRDANLSMSLDTDRCYYGTGSDCPKIIDLYSGERRPSTKQDIANLARFCDALPNIDFIMSFAIAQDEHSGGDFVHGVEAMLLNTKKPIIVTAHGTNDMLTMIKMASLVRGGFSELKEKPCLVLYTEPLSPLVHTEMGVSKGLVCCEYGIPFIYIGSPMMGASAPVTIEGTLVQTVAECLSGLVIFQNKVPGSKFIFGGDATIMDMSTMIFSYGAPELQTLNGALAEMAHYYRLPFFCIAGATDSKLLDAQAGLEYAISLYNATLNGCNLIHDCGYLESGLTSSYESVLLADEIISMIKHMCLPMQFTSNSVPLDVMNKVGPGGTFLKESHTRKNYRNNLWFPQFLDRNVADQWMQAGGKDLRIILNEKARQILEQHHLQPLPDKIIHQIHQIVAKHNPDI